MYKIIGANQAEYGPVSGEQLRQWIAEGRADANTRAQAEGTTEWKPLREFPEFAGLFAAAPPPMAPGRIAPMSAPPSGVPATVPNYLVQAILCTLCCCLPFGIVAIVYAAQVNGKLQAGDYAGAVEASRKAKMWCWIAFGVGLVTGVIGVIIQLAVGLSGMHQ
ncbi:MAG: Interferon-induced transrane protein [Pedosphaera sp.]|nr:Interferon-induced transrane protein [Pedosphaera sp.]